MTVARLFVLRFANGKSLAYGVPEFLSDDEVTDFLAYAQDELDAGAAQYVAVCCQPAEQRQGGTLVGDSDDDDSADEDVQAAGRSRELTFSRSPSGRLQELQSYANQLRDMGQRSRAHREAQRTLNEREAEWARQREAVQQRENSRGQDRGP